jgi:inhibitor of cysteine peptidase
MTREGPNSQAKRIGDVVEVRLPEKPSTGYRWQLEDTDPEVAVLEISYTSSSDRRVAGGPGVRIFRLRVSSHGPVDLVFRLRRPWDPHSAALERRVVSVPAADPD